MNGHTQHNRSRSDKHTIVLLNSPFQNPASLIQLTSTTAASSSSELPLPARTFPTNRAVTQLTLHPSVPVRRISEVSGGRRRYGSNAGGIRLRVEDMMNENMVI